MKKKGYHFCTIQTDGVGVSICFQKDGLTNVDKHMKRVERLPQSLEDLNTDQMVDYRNRKLVGGDPGKQSSIYLMDEQHKHQDSAEQKARI